MAIINFKLIHSESGIEEYSFSNLRECVKFIKNFINNPKNYEVQEFEYFDMVEICNAMYLIETFKDLDTLPLSLQDI